MSVSNPGGPYKQKHVSETNTIFQLQEYQVLAYGIVALVHSKEKGLQSEKDIWLRKLLGK